MGNYTVLLIMLYIYNYCHVSSNQEVKSIFEKYLGHILNSTTYILYIQLLYIFHTDRRSTGKKLHIILAINKIFY